MTPQRHNKIGIRLRLILLFSVTLLTLLAIGLYAASHYQRSLLAGHAIRDQAHQALLLASELELHLQAERAAWNTVLLRGQQPDQYYAHLAEFYDHERRSRAAQAELRTLLADDARIVAVLDQLAQAHLRLGKTLRQAMRLFNETLDEGQQLADRIAASQQGDPQRLIAELRQLVEQHREAELARQARENGRAQSLFLMLLLLAGGLSAVLFIWLLDVNIGKPAQHAAYLANYDPLTGLPNRTLFQDRLQHAIAQADRNGASLALLFFDLDHFKAVNDALGHHVGDELLTQAGGRLLSVIRSSDTPARLGGDEFAVIVENAADEADVIHVANHIIEALNQPFTVANQQAYVSASIGITFYPADAEDANNLLKNADAAMYLAKQKGRGQYHFFTEELNRVAEQRLQLETQLRTALPEQRFELHFQPQLALADGRLVGAEALLRFKSREELVPPDRFIPVLEDTGLILAVGEWVIAEACRWGAHWQAKTGYPLRVAVNLSVRQLQDRSLPDKIAAILAETGFPEPCLELEVTEGDLLDLASTGKVLNELRRLGIRLAIDDFGTGYSSLSYLKSFAVDLLKIDRSFIRDIHHDRDDDAVTSAIIALAHKLEIEVIAEGVETIEQQAFLTLQGCDLAQGFLLSRPLPTDKFEAWLLERLQRQRSLPPQGPDAMQIGRDGHQA